LDIEDDDTIIDDDSKRERITITQFIQKYNATLGALSRHFSRPIFANSYNNIFGKIKYLGVISHSKQRTQETLKIPEFPEKDDIS
jgi:hypothetical protein